MRRVESALGASGPDDVVAEQEPVRECLEHLPSAVHHGLGTLDPAFHAVHLDVGCVVAVDKIHAALLPNLEGDAENEVDNVGIGSVGTYRCIRIAFQPSIS